MQGDPKVDELMRPVNAAIRRHVKNGDAVTDIYNRAYEAVMEVQDALNVSAAVAAKQIAENAKNLQRAESAEAQVAALREKLDDIAFAAHMPDGYSDGLSGWIWQELYSGYIGAKMSPILMQQIENGRLIFPNAPVYKENADLRAALQAANEDAERLYHWLEGAEIHNPYCKLLNGEHCNCGFHETMLTHRARAGGAS